MSNRVRPTKEENAQRDWRDRYYRSPLISHRWLAWTIGAVSASVVGLCFRAEFGESYTMLRASLPAAMIAVAGFVIAALAILVSTATAPTVGAAIGRQRPDIWRTIINQASGAAKLAGTVAILVSIEPFLRAALETFLPMSTIDIVWLAVFVYLTTLVVIAALRVIWLLERAATSVHLAS